MKLAQLAQRAVDLDRAAAFYSALLGAAPTARYDPPGLLFFDLDGVRLLLDREAPTALHYLSVDSIADALARLPEAEVLGEPHVVFSHADDTLGPAGHDEWQTFLRDSEGNTVGLGELRSSA